MDPSTLSFILFSCPLIPWVRRLILRMDLWSDGITHPLGNTLWLTSYPEAINAVGTRDMFLVVIHSNRSVSSSRVPFPLYICCVFISFFTSCNKLLIKALPSTLSRCYSVYLVWLSSTPFPLPSSHRQTVSILQFMLSFPFALPFIQILHAHRLRKPIES